MLVTTPPKLNRKRTLARISARFPLLFFTLAVLVGQLAFCASTAPAWVKLLIVTPILLLFARYGAGGRLTLWSLLFVLFGFVEQRLNLSLPRTSAPFEQSGVLVEIDGPLRQRRTDELTLPIKILGSLTTDRGVRSEITLSPLQPGERALCKAVNLPWRNIAGSLQGDRLLIRGSFQALKLEGLFDFSSTLLRQGYSYRCKILHSSKALGFERGWNVRARIALLNHFSALLGDSERSGLLLSLFLGVRDLLHTSTEEAFKRTGLAHLLVFSGYQVVLFFHFVELISISIIALLARIFIDTFLRVSSVISLRKLSLIIALAITLLFEAVVGAEQSTIRASLALFFFVVAKLAERGGSFFNAILFALFIMLLISPGCMLEPGVQLTFAALCGIGLAQGHAERNKISIYLRTQGYIWLLTTPLSLIWFGRGSLIALPLNLVLAPLVAFLACNLGAVFLALNLSGIDRGGLLLGYLADVLIWIRDIVLLISRWPAISFELDPVESTLACLVAAILIVMLCKSRINEFLNQESRVRGRK